MLSGNWHEVLTGIAVVKVSGNEFEIQNRICKKQKSNSPNFPTREIEFLVEKGEPLDKAGAYAVQAQAALFIEEIKGDYWNVVGLPVNLVYQTINSFGQKKTG